MLAWLLVCFSVHKWIVLQFCGLGLVLERFLEKSLLPAFKIHAESRNRGKKMRNYCIQFQSRGSYTLLKPAFYTPVCAWQSSKLYPFHICMSQSGVGDIALPFCPLLSSPLSDAGLEPLPLFEFHTKIWIFITYTQQSKKLFQCLLLATSSVLTSRSWLKQQGDRWFLNLMNK